VSLCYKKLGFKAGDELKADVKGGKLRIGKGY